MPSLSLRSFPFILWGLVALFVLMSVLIARSADANDGLVCVGASATTPGIWAYSPERQAQMQPGSNPAMVPGNSAPQAAPDPRIGTPCGAEASDPAQLVTPPPVGPGAAAPQSMPQP